MREAPTSLYPVRFWLDYPEQLNRILNLPLFIGTLIKTILLIPHLVILLFVWLIALIVMILIAPFGILFTGNYPNGLWNFVVGAHRWSYRVVAYLLSFNDRYPPFSLKAEEGDLAHFEAEYPESLSRWLNFPIIGPVLKVIWAYVVLAVASTAFYITVGVVFLAQFAILFTGRFPEKWYRFAETPLRLSAGANGYVFALTDAYPFVDLTPRRAMGLSEDMPSTYETGPAG
jgi:Domain of unknown function (DUF4389)